MKIIKPIFLFIGITIALLVGCVGMESKKFVQDNNFYSSNYPKMRININPDFKYLGVFNTEYSKQNVYGTNSQTIKKDIFVFGQIGDNDRIKKGIFIDFHKLRRGRWLPDIHASMKYKIESSSMIINGNNFQSAVKANTGVDKELTPYLQDKGYSISNLYLTKVVSRIVTRDQSILMHIIYVEDIDNNDDVGKYSINDWQNLVRFSNAQRTFLNEFLDRSEKNIQFGSEGAGIAKSEKDVQTASEGVSLDKSERDTQIVNEGAGLSKSENDIQTAHKEKDSDRDVNYNIFQPTKYPKIKFKINPDLKYIGEFKRNYKKNPSNPWWIDRVTYSFWQVGDRNLIKRGVFIDYRRRPLNPMSGPYRSNFFNEFKIKSTLDSTSLIINENNYQSTVFASNSVPLDDMNKYLGDKGCTLSNINMVRVLGRVVPGDGRTLMVIFYIEDIHDNEKIGKYSINDWQSAVRLSNAQRTFLHEFRDRSEKEIQIVD